MSRKQEAPPQAPAFDGRRLIQTITVHAFADQSVEVGGLSGVEFMESGILARAIRRVQDFYEEKRAKQTAVALTTEAELASLIQT